MDDNALTHLPIEVPAQKPLSDNPLIDWLLREGVTIPLPRDLVGRLGRRPPRPPCWERSGGPERRE